MWRGWNSVTMVVTLPVQRIGYMENIAFPPTRLCSSGDYGHIREGEARVWWGLHDRYLWFGNSQIGNRKGKTHSYELMLKNSEVLDAFSQLRKSQVVLALVTKSVSMYTCNLYGGRGMFRDVNHARHTLMSKKILQRKAKQNLSKLKSFDPATLPPCLCVLE